MRELYHTEEDIFPNERDKRTEKKNERKKLFRVLNTLNVWVPRVSLGRNSSLLRSVCAVNTTDKTLRLAFSHILSLSPRNIFARREISVCLLLSVFFRVVVVAFS